MIKKYFFTLPFLLLLLASIPLLDLLHVGLPITHDGQDHVARIADFYQNLSEGTIIPRWAANLNWGFGHPILMFLYPLPSYAASLFHFMGFSLVDSTKIVFGLAYLLSGLAMYVWVREFLDKRAGFIAALLYVFVPYRFVDLYVRGAIGEHIAFIFTPLILYFLLKLAKRYSYWHVVGAALSLAGLILAHNAISLMFLPLLFFYALFLVSGVKDKKTLSFRFVMCAIFGFGISAFFWMPAFFEGKYTLRDIVTSGEVTMRSVSFGSLLYGPWNYGGSGQFTTQIGIAQWVLVIASFFATVYFYRKKNRLWIFSTGLLVVFFFTLFLMTEASNIVWNTITILQKFQFPWRFLSVTVFTAAVLGGLVVFTTPKKFQVAVCCSLVFAALWFNKDYWHARDYLIKEESFFTGIYKSTTDTGESSPIWSVRFMEKEPKEHMEIIDGDASIKELKRTSIMHEYGIEVKNRSRIRENTLYFPGWEVLIDGQKTDVEFQDSSNRGLITFFVEKGSHSVEIHFVDTKLRMIATMLSSISIVLLCVYILKGRLQWQKST